MVLNVDGSAFINSWNAGFGGLMRNFDDTLEFGVCSVG